MADQDVQVKVYGGRALRTALRQAEGNLKDLTALNQQAATIVIRRAEQKAPRRTGALKRSLTPARAATRATVRSNLVYAGVIHFGWPARNIPANPFVFQAAQATEREWAPLYTKGMQDLCDQVAGSANGTGP